MASIQETNNFTDEDIAYIAKEQSDKQFEDVKIFVKQFNNTKTFGSLVNINCVDINFIANRSEEISNTPAKNFFEDSIRQKVM